MTQTLKNTYYLTFTYLMLNITFVEYSTQQQQNKDFFFFFKYTWNID